MSTPVATLLPLTSLRNFKAALNFIRWLAKTGQSGWQMLPINDPITTPYRSDGIGLASHFYDNRVPREYRTWLLSRNEFIASQQRWLLDYALFKALSEKYHTRSWWRWPQNLAQYDQAAISATRIELADRIDVYIDEQYFLFNQFLHLKRFAANHNIILSGDLPFYVSQESALVWAHQELFMLGRGGQLKMESGVPAHPNEPFAQQFWGHPLYDWEGNSTAKIMSLFSLRLEFMSQLFDLVRVDHANGFFKYGIMSRQHPGWNKKANGPGSPAVKLLLKKFQELGLGVYFEDIASDKLRLEHFMKEYEVAGSSVLTLMYNIENTNQAQAAKVPDKNYLISRLGGSKIIFSSTHDTPPLITWVKNLPPDIKEKIIALNHLPPATTDKGLACNLRDMLLQQNARLIVIAWQDWHLDNFRFNVPGQEELTNWDYIVPISKYL